MPDEKWFDNRDKNEGSQNSKSGAQSSKDVWVNSDDVNKGTQTESGTSSKEAQVPKTVDAKIQDTEDENQEAGTRNKKRRGKPRFREGVRARRAAKERLRDLTSPEEPPAVVESPASPSEDEGSLTRSHSLL